MTTPLTESLTRAIALHRDGQLEPAERAYRSILSTVPDQPDTIHFLGVLMHQKGQSEAAVGMINRAIRLCPDHADMHNNLGNVLRELGRLPEALEAYGRATELKPDLVSAWFNRGESLRKLGRSEESASAYQRVTVLKPDHRRGLARLAQAQYRLGRTEQARDTYRQWLDHEPDHPVARHMFAACSQDDAPPRCSDEYVVKIFDDFAARFDDHLSGLDYRGPGLIGDALASWVGSPWPVLRVLDAGCGTGLCAPVLRPYAVRLTGVDLSGAMLDRARELDLYDELITGELTAALEAVESTYDLIASSDTLVYFGELRPVFSAASTALRSEGLLVFTVERPDGSLRSGFELHPSGRYRHDREYIERTVIAAELELASIEPVVLRQEAGAPVAGWVVVARRGV